MDFECNRRYLTEKKVSANTVFSVFTLRNNRHMGRGLPYFKIGRNVRYLPEDIEKFMTKQRITPED